MQLKTKTDYAIRVMLYLSDKKEGTRREMASALGINEYYFPKIIRPLRDKHWISSTTGSVGGFSLIEKPENITLLDIIETMEGSVKFSNFLEEEQCWSQNQSVKENARRVFQFYQEHMERYFSSITLKGLLESEREV
jgi:Rrf2 family nitric oxide-sensitive transcriptional repressor